MELATSSAAATIGVEEEFFVVDPETRAPRPAAASVIERAAREVGELVSGEFTGYQIEVKTPPCTDTDRLRAELVGLRAAAGAAASAEGLRLCASGAPVLLDHESLVIADHPRYRAGLDQYRAMLDDFVVCSLHVHVYLPDRELAVRVSNHLRRWLPLLIALSANSPFHRGADTRYADWRAAIRSRFPCLGPPPYAESARHHDELAAAMAASGAMLDAVTPFWDVRLNARVSTLEVRTMDVTADVDDTVALAALTRALVATAAAEARAGDPGPPVNSELLRAAYWRAARDGWSGCGVDPQTGTMLPFRTQAAGLVHHVRSALDDTADMSTVTSFLQRLEMRGAGAELQRASAARRGALTDVVDDLMDLTARR